MKSFVEKSLPILLTSSLVLGATACGEQGYTLDPSQESRVTELNFEPEHEENGVCLLSSSGVCLLYDQVTVADEWTMTIQQCEDGPRPTSEDSNCDSETQTIEHRDFDALRIGSVIIINNGEISRIPQ